VSQKCGVSHEKHFEFHSLLFDAVAAHAMVHDQIATPSLRFQVDLGVSTGALVGSKLSRPGLSGCAYNSTFGSNIMGKTRFSFLAISVLLFLSNSVLAVTHDVVVGNDFFSPNDLTITVGDTVRWTNSSGFHDVTADDGSWASETSNSFVFERTFNSVEEVLYYCTVHSIPGQDIASNMNGRLNVIEADSFLVNSAISDAWFNPATDGQGFFIIVWPGIDFVFLSWFTFDTERPPADVTANLGDPGHRWVTAQGPFTGDTATLDVFVSSGGTFNSPTPEVTTVQDGSITIKWSGCNSGILTYTIPSLELMGEIPIERIVLDNVPACEAAQTSQ
jgi:plastocyanin